MQSEKHSCDTRQIEPVGLVYLTYVPLDNLRQRLPIHETNNGDLGDVSHTAKKQSIALNTNKDNQL
jgi:hypothetical protein